MRISIPKLRLLAATLIVGLAALIILPGLMKLAAGVSRLIIWIVLALLLALFIGRLSAFFIMSRRQSTAGCRQSKTRRAAR